LHYLPRRWEKLDTFQVQFGSAFYFIEREALKGCDMGFNVDGTDEVRGWCYLKNITIDSYTNSKGIHRSPYEGQGVNDKYKQLSKLTSLEWFMPDERLSKYKETRAKQQKALENYFEKQLHKKDLLNKAHYGIAGTPQLKLLLDKKRKEFEVLEKSGYLKNVNLYAKAIPEIGKLAELVRIEEEKERSRSHDIHIPLPLPINKNKAVEDKLDEQIQETKKLREELKQTKEKSLVKNIITREPNVTRPSTFIPPASQNDATEFATECVYWYEEEHNQLPTQKELWRLIKAIATDANVVIQGYRVEMNGRNTVKIEEKEWTKEQCRKFFNSYLK